MLISFFVFIVKRNYYRLAKIYHPDRVSEQERSMANEVFNMIYQAYDILSNFESKKIYDIQKKSLISLRKSNETHICGWSKYIKIVDNAAFETKKREYQGSMAEKNDVLREILNGNGSMTHLYNTIPFMRYEDEIRLIGIIKSAIEAGEMKKITIKKIPNRK